MNVYHSIQLNRRTNRIILEGTSKGGNHIVQHFTFDDFLLKYTGNRNEQIADLRQALDINNETLSVLTKNSKSIKKIIQSIERDYQEAKQRLRYLLEERETITIQLKNLLTEFENIASVNWSVHYKQAINAFLNQNFSEVSELVDEQFTGLYAETNAEDNARFALLNAINYLIAGKFNKAAIIFQCAIDVYPSVLTYKSYADFLRIINPEESTRYYIKALNHIRNQEQASEIHAQLADFKASTFWQEYHFSYSTQVWFNNELTPVSTKQQTNLMLATKQYEIAVKQTKDSKTHYLLYLDLTIKLSSIYSITNRRNLACEYLDSAIDLVNKLKIDRLDDFDSIGNFYDEKILELHLLKLRIYTEENKLNEAELYYNHCKYLASNFQIGFLLRHHYLKENLLTILGNYYITTLFFELKRGIYTEDSINEFSDFTNKIENVIKSNPTSFDYNLLLGKLYYDYALILFSVGEIKNLLQPKLNTMYLDKKSLTSISSNFIDKSYCALNYRTLADKYPFGRFSDYVLLLPLLPQLIEKNALKKSS